MPGAAYFEPDLVPLDPVRFSNGATVVGFLREDHNSLPLSGQPWTVFMIWRVDELWDEEYSVFVHLVDEVGVKYSQMDMPALPVGQQRLGESVMNRVELMVDDRLPDDGPLFLYFGMYNDDHSAKVLDLSGESIGEPGVIQIRARGKVLSKLDELVLVDTVISADVESGPPLEVLATWSVRQVPREAVTLRWRLISDTGAVAFETETETVSYTHLTLPTNREV